MSKFVAGWHVIYTRPRHEKKVAVGLTDAAINYFLPMTKVMRTWHDRRKVVDTPLFQSYVFVYLKNLHDYYAGLHCSGALYFLRFGQETARVNDRIITNMRLLLQVGSEVEVSSGNFEPGQQLLIREGPLTGVSCEVVQAARQKKILVRVHLISRNLLITMPSEFLVSATA